VAELAATVLFFGLIIGVFIWMTRARANERIMNVGAAGQGVHNRASEDDFDDVAGYVTVKQEIAEVVDFLKSPAASRTSARASEGSAAGRSPGSGKTLLPAVAARRRAFCRHRIDFMEMFRGRRRQRVRDLFQTRASRPSDHFRRRDRLDRPQARARARRRPRRTRTDAQQCWPRWTGSRPPRAS